jgi:outer membrane protein OmpA-like peptidoglycan-associated protein
VFILFALLLVATVAAAQKPLQDFKGLKDPALFTRMPNFFLISAASVDDKQFDSYQFFVAGPKGAERKAVEGHRVTYRYVFDRSTGAEPSALQIKRNYQNAGNRLGGKVLYEDTSRSTFLITNGGTETWVEIAARVGYEYQLTILERQAMAQDVVASADALKSGLAATGHVEVPGIFFDTSKSDIKPESDAALKEIVKLLQADPALKVWVVGHTDNTGADDMNVTLSQARAASVVKALVGMGIAPARLGSHGAGPYAPVSENKTDEGRAKNRRVELVARQ